MGIEVFVDISTNCLGLKLNSIPDVLKSVFCFECVLFNCQGAYLGLANREIIGYSEN